MASRRTIEFRRTHISPADYIRGQAQLERLNSLSHRIVNSSGLTNYYVQSPLERHWTRVYRQLCKQGGKPSNGIIIITDVPHPNAALFFDGAGDIELPDYDFKHLSSSDITALLAHEAGHYIRHQSDTGKHNIIPFTFTELSLLGGLVLTTYIDSKIGTRGKMFANTIFIIASVLLTVAFMYSKNDEVQADRIGAELVSSNAMIHLLMTCRAYEQRQHTELLAETLSLWTCPKAFHEMLVILLRYNAGRVVQRMHLTGHPSYAYRIKKLSKLKRL